MQTFLSCDIAKSAVFSRIMLNKIFGFLTLGFYRFWGKTHLRRMIWQSVSINGDRLTYHGTAKELFIGFLIAMLLLAVLFGVVGVALQFMVYASPQLMGIDQVFNIMFLAAFWQFARYRLWRYRLSRTSYRTVRFFQKGRALVYSAKTMLWSVISLLTLGWAYPKLRAVQADYQINNMAFGDKVFEFRGEVTSFFRIYLPLILFWNSVILVGVFLYFNTGIFATMIDASQGLQPENPNVILYSMGFYLLIAIIATILFIAARVKEFNYTVDQTRFFGARFASRLPIVEVFKIGLLAGFVNVLFFAAVGFVIYTGIAGNNEAMTFALFPLFIVYFILFDIIKYLYLFIPMLKLICRSVAVDKVGVLAEVAASAHEAPTYGEGLADALDVGAF
ncbi:hypothetical protein A9Q83_14710 [Alphaproteobacteria bacterium 46_93_T64]|nr:hypothetical protein A9Q83_14710 [Alphaproteobacteria bacterium 46_93_T64]